MKSLRLANRPRRAELGVALFEAAAWLTTASVLIVGAVAWGTIAHENADVEGIVASEIRRIPVTGIVLDLRGNATVNSAGLARWSRTLEDALHRKISQATNNRITSVAACYWIASTDRNTGQIETASRICPSTTPDSEVAKSIEEKSKRWLVGRPALAAVPIPVGDEMRFYNYSIVLGVGIHVRSSSRGTVFPGTPEDIVVVSSFLPAGDFGL